MGKIKERRELDGSRKSEKAKKTTDRDTSKMKTKSTTVNEP